MVRQGRDLAKIDPWIVVKVPLTRDGIKACKALSSEGIKVNVDALLLAGAGACSRRRSGATNISPFVGRLDDVSTPGMELIRDIGRIYKKLRVHDEDLVASTRSPMHIVEAARLAPDICTCPPA
jgi:transaldolase